MTDIYINHKVKHINLGKELDIILDNIPTLVYLKDKENNFIRINQRVADIYRKSKEQLEGKNLSELHGKEQALANWEDDLEVIRTKKPKINIEETLETKEGIRWFNTKKIPLMDNKGEVNGILGFSIDITKRKEMELLLRKNERQFKSLLKFSQMRGISEKELVDYALEECVRLTGSNVGYFHFINEDQAAIQLHSWSKEVMKNCYSEENTHYPLDQAGIWADCVRKRKPVIHNDYQRAKNKRGLPEGHFPVIRHMSIPIFDGKKIVAIVGVGNKEEHYNDSDIQQLSLFMNNMWSIIKQNRTEEEFIKIAAIVENSNDAIISIDLNGNIDNWNKGAEKIYGYNEKEIKNQHLSIIFPNELANKVSDFTKTIKKGGDIKQFETVNLNNKKERLYVSLSISPIKNLTGEIIGISLITRDITEHKRMEEKYRDLYEKAPNAYFSIGKDKSISKFNKMAEKLLGYTKEEFQNMKVFDLYANTPDGLPKAKRTFKRFVKGDKIRDEELQMKKKNGEHLWVSLSVKPIFDKEGNVVESRSVVLDITKRKIAEQKLKALNEELEHKVTGRTRDLQESEEKYRNLFESNLDGIVMIDIEGRFINSNQAILDMLGYTAEELKTLNFKDITPEKWYENETKAFKEIIKKGHIEGFEKEFIKKNGTIFLVNIKAFLIKRANGEPTGMWAIIRDIAEPKRVYEALRESEERFRMLAEQSLMGIAIIQDDKYVYVNQAFSDIIEYRVEEINNWKLEDIDNAIHPDDLEFVHQQSIKIQQGNDKELIMHYTFRKITKTQKTKWVDHYSKKIIYKNKFALIITQIDITERKQIEENLKKLMADLKRSNEELEQFAYVASHDLQEPLRMIASFAQLLEQRYKDKIDKDANDFINFIVGGAIRLQKLINDLLTFSRIGTRGKPFKATDINNIIRNVKDNLKKLSEESNALITNDPLPIVVADEAQLTQIFQNLISNAIKFHREGISPKVHISGEVKKNKWIFSVADNGIGIDQENFNRIFVIFQRLHKRNKYGGTGIGLAICKKIIQRHGGKIWVDSDPNKGSTFYFSIPKRKIVEDEF